MSSAAGESRTDDIRSRLALFSGDTGGIDSWLTRATDPKGLFSRLGELDSDPLTRSQLNQLLALSHQGEVSAGFFEYYWLLTPSHTYDVTSVPAFHPAFTALDRIISLDQLALRRNVKS